ncbi:hypothetical protein [Saccharopolyspora sp. ASAGF58]|uniref:hypothetical protein n=1 Tax=Saccharopolyspora sp. ASAGF58 TaxID=2719023 RepID=UPI0014483B36|nr:hypothetical protein [Saccharopolyspora sp. ASAGF58]
MTRVGRAPDKQGPTDRDRHPAHRHPAHRQAARRREDRRREDRRFHQGRHRRAACRRDNPVLLTRNRASRCHPALDREDSRARRWAASRARRRAAPDRRRRASRARRRPVRMVVSKVRRRDSWAYPRARRKAVRQVPRSPVRLASKGRGNWGSRECSNPGNRGRR